MPSFKSKKRARRAREREAQAAAEPPVTQAPPIVAPPSPRESPLKRLLRRTSSSLKGLTNRRASVSSVVSRDHDPQPSSSPRLQPLTPTRSAGVDDPFNPFAGAPSHTDPTGGGNISQSGSLRKPITPLRPRPDISTPTPPSIESIKAHGGHRKTSSLASTTTTTTFPGPASTPAQLVPAGKAQIKQSPVVAIETIASSSRDPQSGPRESAAGGTERETAGLALSDFGGGGGGGKGDAPRMDRGSSLGLDISHGDAQPVRRRPSFVLLLSTFWVNR